MIGGAGERGSGGAGNMIVFGQPVVFVAQILGFAVFLWLGLYALARGDRGRVAVLLGAAALVTATFFLQVGLQKVFGGAPGAGTFRRLMWWANIMPIALWLHLSLALRRQVAGVTWRAATLWAVYGAALALSLLSMGTDLVVNYRHATPVVTPGPLYPVYVAYLLVCTGFAVVSLSPLGARVIPLRTGRDGGAPAPGRDGAAPNPTNIEATGVGAMPLDAPVHLAAPDREIGMRLFVAGAVLFLIGTAYLALRFLLGHPDWPEVPPYILLIAGVGAVGAAVAVQSAVVLGRDVRRDFLYSFTVVAVLLLLYLVADGLLIGFGTFAHALFALTLAALIVTSHTLYDPGRSLLDRLFFTPVVREERAAARAYAEALATPPVGPHPELTTRKAFDDAVRRALTHLSDPTKLATTPLLNLQLVARGVGEQGVEDNRLARAAALKEILLDLLDGLKPSDGGKVTGDAWRYYNCLYYPYVRGLGRRRAPTALRGLVERRRRDGGPRTELEQALEWLLQVDEDTFYKWQRRGSDTIAAALREREEAAGGAIPSLA